jgi:hypothetical protein
LILNLIYLKFAHIFSHVFRHIVQHIVSKTWFAVSNIEHKELVTQMRQARFKDNGNLDKAETSNNTYDVFDSTRLALKMFDIGSRGR